MNSALAFGTVRPRRFGPAQNAFAYRVAMQYIDLDEASTLFRVPGVLARGGFGLYAFRRKDYLGDPARPLADCVRDAVEGTGLAARRVGARRYPPPLRRPAQRPQGPDRGG